MRGLAYNPGILPAEMIIRQRVKPMPSISAWVDRKMREPAQAGFLFEFTDAA
ncbi:TPA: DUF2737 family protein [Escherichia coli]|nr:DUF2737 family protein [Escherichia coli]TLI04149.1 DUF2737 family protein [Escherichia coli O25b:H4]NJY64829.1 DUF2737 family protein [Escherichia coli]RXC94042.1 DUF2737 family protein [Escherichia coli]HAG7971267.1 DUF2737 family protein [Escherichia coli]